jgi:hypothetical protein
MRIRLSHLSDPLPQQLRTLLYSTIVSYEHDAPLLRDRVGPALARIDPRTAGPLTRQVCDAAASVLAMRAAMRRGVLEAARAHAAAWLPAARTASRDRTQADDEREAWSRTRVDLEQIATRAETIEAGSFADRLKRIAPPVEETTPSEEEEVDPTSKRFSLLELD